MLVMLVFAIIVLYLASLQIRIKLKGLFDLSAGHGEASFSVFYIKIFKVSGLLEHFSLSSSDFVLRLQNKKKKVHVELKKTTVRDVINVIKNTDLSFLGNLDVRDVILSVHYGGNNAFYTSMLLAGARIAFFSAMSALKSNQPVEIRQEFVPVYDETALKLDFSGIFSLSVADIIFGYFYGKIRKILRKRQKIKGVAQ